MKYRKWMMVAGLMAGLFVALPAARAAGDWAVKSNVQGLYGSYSGSVQRKSLYSAGVIVSADYLDQWGLSVGVNHSYVNFKNSADIKQNTGYGSLRYRIYPDGMHGAFTVSLDGYLINNNDSTGNTDHVKVFAPQISFLNFAKTLYLDVGYARSNYKNNLHVNQYTATLGVGLNADADWLQARGYYIDPSNAARAQNKKHTTAVALKWQHWFAPGNPLRVSNMVVEGLLGERIYAVDGEAASVYNLADIQRGSYSLGLDWKLNQALGLLLIGGQEFYRNNTISNSYHSTYIYADMATNW